MERSICCAGGGERETIRIPKVSTGRHFFLSLFLMMGSSGVIGIRGKGVSPLRGGPPGSPVGSAKGRLLCKQSSTVSV